MISNSNVLLMGIMEVINENVKVTNVFNSSLNKKQRPLRSLFYLLHITTKQQNFSRRNYSDFSHYSSINKLKKHIKIQTQLYSPVTIEILKIVIKGHPKNKSVSGEILVNIL